MLKLRKNNSVFQAEALSILKTIEWFKDKELNKIMIFTDSLSVLKSLNNNFPQSPIVNNILTACTTMDNKEIYIKWIKSHNGFIGNEIADSLAKSSIIIQDTIVKIPYPISHIKQHFQKEMLNNWQSD
jgi:ribonuclease HI